jgi:hypothetical protein
MRTKKSKKLFTIVLTYPNGVTRTVQVRASSREVAETRALKRNPNATGVKYNA